MKKIYLELLLQQLKNGDFKQIEEFWQKLPKPLQKRKEWVLPYSQFLLDSHMQELAEELAREALKTQYDPQLIELYSRIHSHRLNKQIDFALSLLKQQGQDPHILLCLGRLAMIDGALSQASSYLEHSLKIYPSSKTYILLGELSLQLNDKEAALHYFQQGTL